MKAYQLICDSLATEQDDWKVDAHHLRNQKLGVVVWVANGPSFCREQTGKARWGLWGALKVWRAYKLWCVSMIVTARLENTLSTLDTDLIKENGKDHRS